MPYADFAPTKPDPSADNGSDAFTYARENMLWLRDAAAAGTLQGWALAVSGGTAARPTTWTYSKGVERVRLVVSWGSGGGPDGKPTSIATSYSANSGGTYETVGTCTLSYDTSGHFTGSVGSSPGVGSHWLLGIFAQLSDTVAALTAHTGAANPHSGSASTADLSAHAALTGDVHGIPDGETAWHTGALLQASAAQVRATAVSGAFVSPNSIATASAPVTLLDAGTIAVNWNAAINWNLTIAGNRTLGNPTNGRPGTTRTIRVMSNDATAHELSLGDQYWLAKGLDLSAITDTKIALLSIYCRTSSDFYVTGAQFE